MESSLEAGGQANTSQDAQSSGPASTLHDTATLPTQPVLDSVFQPDLSPIQSNFAHEDFLTTQTQRPSFSAGRPSIVSSTGGLVPSPQAQSKTEALERQPRSATGYEWNERNTASGTASDGTASLSVEPDGEGYLGEYKSKACTKLTARIRLCLGGDSAADPADDRWRYHPAAYRSAAV